jgi:hypothetical protein
MWVHHSVARHLRVARTGSFDRRGERAAIPQEALMLWTIFVVLVVLWLLGLVSSYTLGGFIHVLLVLALVVVVVQLLQGRTCV